MLSTNYKYRNINCKLWKQKQNDVSLFYWLMFDRLTGIIEVV